MKAILYLLNTCALSMLICSQTAYCKTFQDISFYNNTDPLTKDSSHYFIAPVTAKIMNGTVELKWESAPSSKKIKFNIWKSEDGIDWIYNKTVFSYDDSLQKLHKTYDLDPTIGSHFYKVTEELNTGERETLGIVYISYDEKYDLKIYPNPQYNHIYLLYNNQFYNFNKIEVLDMNGKKIESYTSETIKIAVDKFDPGFYFLHFLSKENDILKKKIWVKH